MTETSKTKGKGQQVGEVCSAAQFLAEFADAL